MPARADLFDLGSLSLAAGEGRRLPLEAAVEPFDLGGERYEVAPEWIAATLDVSRMIGGGYALRLRFGAALSGPCMRCLEPAEPAIEVDAREVDQPGGGEQLSSPYVTREVLDLAAWARDALALATPVQVLCRPDCAGLCPVCAQNLNELDAEHRHERAPDPRWAKLRDLKL